MFKRRRRLIKVNDKKRNVREIYGERGRERDRNKMEGEEG